MEQRYIFHKNFLKQYNDDFMMYYYNTIYPGVIRADDLINKEQDD